MEDTDDVADFVQQRLEEEGSFFVWMGGEVVELNAERAKIRLPFDDHVTNATEPPTVHGGVTATLVDTVGSLALRPHLQNPYEDQMATINLNVNYLRGADGDVEAYGNVVRAGNSVGVSEIEITQNGETVAVGQAAYRIFSGA